MQTSSLVGLTSRRSGFGGRAAVIALLGLTGLAVAAPSRTHAQSPASPVAWSSVMEADTPLTTVNGTGLVAPRGWSVGRAPAAVVLGAPEGGSYVAFSDTTGGDADAAVAAAWAAYRPGAIPSLEGSQDRAARDGWDQIRAYSYRPAAGEARTIFARALRKGDRWTVAIYDMADEVGEKRDSQVEQIFGKLMPAGYRRESFAGRPAHKIDAQRLAALTGFIESGRAELEIPGVGFGLVQDGKVVFRGGFGVRELGKPEPVDADTAFMIGSNTKALTTLMLAKLVEARRLEWDAPVASLWPAFRLGGAQVTAKVRVNHLVCA